ncbi:MAG: pyruvate kinase [Gammaproteobacteria bacterium]
MPRRTKIVATLGPATSGREQIEALLVAGVDVFRINFSHGKAADHRERVKHIRDAAQHRGRGVGILGDLQGPKIRIARFADGAVSLNAGDEFVLDAELDADGGTQRQVGLTYAQLPQDVRPGDTLLLDDGRVVLDVDKVAKSQIHTHVQVGGALSNNKGINRLGGGLSAPAITDKDRADVELAAEIGVDYLGVSFPRNAKDILEARALLTARGCEAGIVAKIERAESLDVIDEIIAVSDAIMIARGDLGVEIGDAELPSVQKDLIARAREQNRIVVTATQMMESMINNPLPTRAEVSDVANAVIDGTDAVMLSAETAIGEHPPKAVEAMDRVCRSAEKNDKVTHSDHRIDSVFQRVDEAIAMATMYTANHLAVRAIAALTESGATTLWMSRIGSLIPIYALTRHDSTCGTVSLCRGVYPVKLTTLHTDYNEANRVAVEMLLKEGVVTIGDLVVITKGDLMGTGGGTNAMKIVRVGQLVEK